MQELLGKYKKTKYATPSIGEREISPHGKTVQEIFEMVVKEFKVGDFINLYSTIDVRFEADQAMWPIPENFELRVRNAPNGYTIFYPFGYVIWMRMKYEKGLAKQFKCDQLEDEKGIPYFKIWRAK